MKLKLITRPELPEPEVTIASAPKDKEAERIMQALQGIGNTLFAYRERTGTSEERVAISDICSLEAADEETLLHMADGRTLFAAQRALCPRRRAAK